MSIIVLGSPGATDADLHRVAYHNLLEQSGAAVTVSEEDTTNSGDKENAYDWDLATKWKTTTSGDQWIKVTMPAATNACAACLARHNLSTQGGVWRVVYSTLVSPADPAVGHADWTEALGPQSPALDQEGFDPVIYRTYTDTPAKHWAIIFSSLSTTLEVGAVFIGPDLVLQRGPGPGFSSPFMGVEDEIIGGETADGNPTLRSLVRKASTVTMTLDTVDDDWMRAYWFPFRNHARTKNWFYLWHPTLYPSEAAFCWPLRNTQGRATYSTVLHADLTLDMKAAVR